MVIYNIITTNLSPSRTLITYSEYKFYMCAYCVSLEVSYIWLCPQLWRARKTWCVGGILDAHHVCPSLSRLLHIFKPLITQHILVSLRSTHTFTRSHPTSSTTWHHPLFSPSMTPYSVPHTSPLQTCLLPNPSAINPRCHHPPTQTFFRLGGVYSLTLLCQ